LADGRTWIYDATTTECPDDEFERVTYEVTLGAAPHVRAVQLGDARVQDGYPFVLSPDQTKSLHVGLVNGAAAIVVTDVVSGKTEVVSDH
jgi:superfamily II helicase